MVTNADVSQLNASFRDLGDSFMQTRLEKDRLRQQGVENNQRQQGLDIASDRNRIAEQDDQTRALIAAKKADIEEYTAIYEKLQKKVQEGNVSSEQLAEWNAALEKHPANHAFRALLKLTPPGADYMPVSRDSGVLDKRTGKMVIPKPEHPDRSANLKPKLSAEHGIKLRFLYDKLGKVEAELRANNETTPGASAPRNKLRNEARDIQAQIEAIESSVGGAPAAPKFSLGTKPAAGGKPLDRATAQAILQEAGGDRDKARELAKQRGYTF